MSADDAQDNDYVSRTGQKDTIPVQKDDALVEDPVDENTADSDAQLGISSSVRRTDILKLIIPAEKDDKDAIDKSNIIDGGRTRGAGKPSGTYQDPGDEEGLPNADGTSSGAQ